MSADILERSYVVSEKVLAGLAPSHFGGPTPCDGWTVRDLVEHMAVAPVYFAMTAETGTAPSGDDVGAGSGDGEPSIIDLQATYRQSAARAVAAFRSEGAMERTMKLPFGELPGSAVVMLAALDAYQHAWDLARATGQPADLDRDLATTLLGFARMAIPDDVRGEGGPFGAKVEVPDDAPPADQLAGFLGRRP